MSAITNKELLDRRKSAITTAVPNASLNFIASGQGLCSKMWKAVNTSILQAASVP